MDKRTNRLVREVNAFSYNRERGHLTSEQHWEQGFKLKDELFSIIKEKMKDRKNRWRDRLIWRLVFYWVKMSYLAAFIKRDLIFFGAWLFFGISKKNKD